MIFFDEDDRESYDAVDNFVTRISEYKDIKDQSIAVMGMRSQDWRQRNVGQGGRVEGGRRRLGGHH